ncbi:MAG TPA: 1-deoxy-D-xylulose-5-phosphate synthase N-terminal domain-containing protein [Acidimicrobiales bacterium]|nr:1-deoxy-D-xylulose-5-phosphate synthase N-terminal domain-containing protein [Acidimicrobiales bacterium]
MIHHANRVRTSRSGLKVGGHQASSASMVSIMTALYFEHLRAADRVSVKPHASPVLHAINYLLGRLDERYLTELRAYGGLQSYPSRTKDPDPVDFSTGSVGIGATASIWSAVARRYVSSHWGPRPPVRHIALVGDAELDEGAVWEALMDPMVARLGEVLWIVDLNRQSLDRVVPGIAAIRIRDMFSAVGWNTITLKYGARLRALFALEHGELLESRIDLMSNEEYQHLLRLPEAQLREAVAGTERYRGDLVRLLSGLDDATIAAALRNLGGHDLGDLVQAFDEAAEMADRPTVVLAYTIKAWRLPTEGHPGNHSALLTDEQWEQLGRDLGADPAAPWAAFAPGSPEGMVCAGAGERLATSGERLATSGERVATTGERLATTGERLAGAPGPRPMPPTELGIAGRSVESTQQALGRFLLELSRTAPDVAARVVTVSPDVASSTNLGGWVNRVGNWDMEERPDWFEQDRSTLVHWRQTPRGQHIELGIAEVNLAGLLCELGLTWARDGEPLLPLGTLYDPFVARCLEPWAFGIYSGGQSILVGTPSGVTLAPEGGAHQSVITPSIGLEQPRCTAWEPAFVQDLEWALLHALGQLGRPDGTSAYFRLSTRPLDQALAAIPRSQAARERRRLDVLEGGYRARQSEAPPAVTLVGMGAVMPEVLGAATALEEEGVGCDVVCLTSADLVFRAAQARRALAEWPTRALERVFPRERATPMVTVVDGHPHTLSFLGTINSTPVACLGVSDFGQVGEVDDLYRTFGIDAATIAGAAWDLLDEVGARDGPHIRSAYGG